MRGRCFSLEGNCKEGKRKNAPSPGRSTVTDEPIPYDESLLRNSRAIAAHVHCYTFYLPQTLKSIGWKENE